MELLYVGLTYQNTPMAIREKFSMTEEEAGIASRQLQDEKAILENVILSTCNRTEVFALVDQVHTGRYYIKHFIADWFGVEEAAIDDYFEIQTAEQLVRHVFRLASGLESQIFGETQILGQLSRAYDQSRQQGATRKILNYLFKGAIHFGKQVQANYQLNDRPRSVTYQAVSLMREDPELSEQTLTIIGLGEIGKLMVRYVRDLPFKKVYLVNRTFKRAVSAASLYKDDDRLQPLPMDHLDQAILDSDKIFCAVDTVEPLIRREDLEDVLDKDQGRRQRVFYDMGVPRNIDPELNQLEDTKVYNIDELNSMIDDSASYLTEAARDINDEVQEKVVSFYEWWNGLDAVTVVAKMREKETSYLETVKESLYRKLPELDQHQRKVINKHMKSLVNHMLKEPMKQTKELIDSPNEQENLDFVKRLFGLNSQPVTSKRAKERRTYRVGTRGSLLAKTQTQLLIDQLEKLYPELNFELVTITTQGDRDQHSSLSKIGGKGVFVKRIEEALLDGEIDFAVHSLKDMPGKLAKGTCLAAFPKREIANDYVIFRDPDVQSLDQLPDQAKIGTGSQRRKIQLGHHHPHFQFVDLRGNVDTRIQKMKDQGIDAIILAEAGLKRLGWLEKADRPNGAELSIEESIPAVGQGALAVQCREDDHDVRHLLSPISHQKSMTCLRIERDFLRCVGGDCTFPLACHAAFQTDGQIWVTGLLGVEGSREYVQDSFSYPAEDSHLAGRELFNRLLEKGGEPYQKLYRKN